MITLHIAQVLAGLVGVGIIVIGIRFLIQPAACADGFGVAIAPAPGVNGYLATKAVRDIASGLFIFALLVLASTQVVGVFLLLASLIAFGDMGIVLRNGGKPAVAFGVHGATGAVIVVAGLLFLLA
ncbi:MAG TPA: DUF4267 domain-containing protein [Pseudonocardiaceae bacterium]|jgi:hypothetical protein|nr:DUF4267 domain-containing protein [Pseudonocardiaceae bacterium]